MSWLRHRRNANRATSDAEDADALLVARAQENLDAFAPIYDRYFAQVYYYCLDELRDPAAAEDATSQVFLRAMHSLPGYHETGRFRSWLFTVAHNVIVNSRRGRVPGAPIETAWDLPDPAATPEELAVAALDLAAIDALIADLPMDDRRVIELRRAGLSGREIADVLGISYEAAKKRQLRAMDRLETALCMKQSLTGGRDGR